MWVKRIVAPLGRPTGRMHMVCSRSVQLVELLKKWLVHPESAVAWKSLMVEVEGTKVVENVRLLMSNILVSLDTC